MLVRYLKEKFETKESKLNQFLGVEIYQRPDGTIFIYYKCILKKFNLEEAKVVHIPIGAQYLLDSNRSHHYKQEKFHIDKRLEAYY